MPTKKRHYLRWVIAAVCVVVLLGVGGPFVYIHFINGPAPAPLQLPTAKATTNKTSASALDGTWTVGRGSIAGYRVKEVLVGQNTTAVGRTSSVTGSIVLADDAVSSGSFTVDLTTVKSNEAERDAQFEGRIMDTATYPDAVFRLTRAIALGSSASSGKVFTTSATGTLTMHGATRVVTFPLNARFSAALLDVQGSIPVSYGDWGIVNPSFGGFVTVQNHGLIEFVLELRH